MEIIKNVIYRVFAFVFGSLILCGCISFYSFAADNESYDYYCKFTDVNQGKSINHANKSYTNAVNNTGQYTRLVLLKDATLQTSTGSGLDYYQYYVADYIDDSGYFQNHTYYKFSFKQMRYSDLAESSLYDSTSFDSTYLTDFYAGVDFPIETNIPIFENTEKGLADAKNYLETGDDSGRINVPDWSSGVKDNSFGLNCFSGSLNENLLSVTWDGVSSRVVDISEFKYTGVRSIFTFKTSAGLIDIEGGVYKISDNGFDIDLSTFSDGLFYSLKLTPYYFSGDSLSGTLHLGVDSIFYNPSVLNGYDGSLFNIMNCQYSTIPPLDCHGNIDTLGCFKLSWTPDGYNNVSICDTYEVKLYAKISVCFDKDVKRSYYTFCFPVGDTDVYTVDGQHVFCSYDIANYLYSNGYIVKNSVFNNYDMGSFQINEVYKLYVRTIREDLSTGAKKYGNWSVYDFNSKKWYLNYQQDITDGRVVIGDTDPDDDGDISGGDGGKITLPDDPNDGNLVVGDIDFSDIVSIGKYFISLVNSLLNVIGSFPKLFSTVFSFLPSELVGMIYLSIVLIIIIGLIKAFL